MKAGSGSSTYATIPGLRSTCSTKGGWGTHVSIIGHIDEMREDTGLADIDRIAQHYIGGPYPQRDRRRISAWIAVDGWHGWGALKDNSQAAG